MIDILIFPTDVRSHKLSRVLYRQLSTFNWLTTYKLILEIWFFWNLYCIERSSTFVMFRSLAQSTNALFKNQGYTQSIVILVLKM